AETSSQAAEVGGLGQTRSRYNARRREGRFRPCDRPGTGRRQAPRRVGPDRLRFGRRPRGSGRRSRQHLPRRVHREIRRLGVCAALLPEEVQDRNQDTKRRHGSDPRQAESSETGFRSMAGPARSTSMTRSTAITIEEGSTNVYADLGYAEAAEMQRKSQLAAEIARAIKARRLTQQEAAELLGIDQSKISRITRGQFRGVSEAKLLELVTRLGHDVRIVVGPVRRRAGKIELEFA